MYTEYDFENKSHFLILRGHFEEKVENEQLAKITGIDSILCFDYMGAAEYEFGAVPESLKRMVNLFRDNQLAFDIIDVQGEDFVLYHPTVYGIEKIRKIEAIINDLARYEHNYSSRRRSKYSVKMGTHFNSYFQGTSFERLKKGCKKKTETVNNYSYCNFWWDIEGDFMFFPLEHKVSLGHPANNSWITTSSRESLIQAFEALDKKGYGKKDIQKSIMSGIVKAINSLRSKEK